MSEREKRRWTAVAWTVGSIVVLATVCIVSRGIRELPEVRAFIAAFPGYVELPPETPIGIPPWLGWQHFFNAFFLVLIVRSGWLIRTTTRPAAYWTRRNTGRLRTSRPPRKISLTLWLHLSLDVLWVTNGLLYVVLLVVTGHWLRIVPTSLEVLPNALSVALQYASLEWPAENSWVYYNALQTLAYFVTVFLAAPVAIVTGVRMSPLWPSSAARLNRIYPIELARAVHFPVMLYFVVFTIGHVTLVLATGALRNLNHMFASRDDETWIGFAIFAAGVVAIAAAWLAARPVVLRSIASLAGKVTRD